MGARAGDIDADALADEVVKVVLPGGADKAAAAPAEPKSAPSTAAPDPAIAGLYVDRDSAGEARALIASALRADRRDDRGVGHDPEGRQVA
jgi:hypothetical protein